MASQSPSQFTHGKKSLQSHEREENYFAFPRMREQKELRKFLHKKEQMKEDLSVFKRIEILKTSKLVKTLH